MEPTEFSKWQESRQKTLTGPTGNLSLVETRWFVPGTTAQQAAELIAAEKTAVQQQEGVTVTPMERTSLITGQPEYGLRVWRADSLANSLFLGMDSFAYNPEWVLTGSFVPGDSAQEVPFEHIRDEGLTRNIAVPGTVTVTVNGKQLELTGFVSGSRLVIPFADHTTGVVDPATGEPGPASSYAPGRFLAVKDTPETKGFTAPGTVELNFNYAYVPPCGFSAQYNCPMPPVGNRLPAAVTAGEKRPRFKDNADVHTLT